MNISKIRALADYIEKHKQTFNMGDPNHCIVGYGLKMDGEVGYYEIGEGLLQSHRSADRSCFAKRFGMPYEDVNLLYAGYLHAHRGHDAAGSARLLRDLAAHEEAKQPKAIQIDDKSVGPIAITVAVRKTAEVRELVPA